MRSEATTVEGYLKELSPERREAISKVRRIILNNLPEGYKETMNWGMISYEVPLNRYPNTYNGQPLSYAALASQKNHIAIYMSGVYSDERQLKKLLSAFQDMDIKPNMGKSCVRFKNINQVPLMTIGELIAGYSVEDFIALYEKSR